MRIVLRLEFENVYPEEDPKEITEYLSLVSKDILLGIIGFSNTYPQPNYDTVCSNPKIKEDIINRVDYYCKKNNIISKPELVSREASLKLAEIILSNKDNLLENNNLSDIDTNELNLFKAYLIINKEVNKKGKLLTSEELENRDKLAQTMIAMSFSTADIGLFGNTDMEFSKLIYCTIVKVELLVKFLQSNSNYKYLEENLFKYFNTKNIEDLVKHVKYLFTQLLTLKANNSFKLLVKDKESKLFLDSLISDNIIEDNDYTQLRNHPMYKIDENTYSIIDYFFVVDKFYRSVKFILKDIYNKENNLSSKDGGFFSFFGENFSENFLMKSILDKYFSKKYFLKKIVKENKDGEPDYYVRHNKRIFIFENKDTLITAKTKSSGDIDLILKELREKFFENKKGKSKGINQLINSICEIVENRFEFDKYVNTKQNFIIYPILLVNDRILEILGVNYILNQWYLDKVKEKLKEKYKPRLIKNLTIIDIDTLIFGLNYFIEKDRNFRGYLDNHLNEMSKERKYYGKDVYKLKKFTEKDIQRQMSPISNRFDYQNFPINLLMDKFEDLIVNKE